jgi:LAO/AO transport system kinase
LEIADILVVNKADRPGVENTERALRSMLDLGHPRLQHHFQSLLKMEDEQDKVKEKDQPEIWIPPIQRTVSTEGTGIEELAALIQQHQDHLRQSGGWQRREQARLKVELHSLLQEELITRWRSSINQADYENILEGLYHRKLTPQEAVKLLTQSA